MSKFTNAALELRRQGYSVIPCKSGSKESLVPWKQYQKKPPTEKKIKEWGVKYPDANVGIVTGKVSRIIVLDLDGPEAEREVEKRGGVPKTPCSKTRKGYHYVFRYPDFPVRSGSDKKLSIDIRADGGYIVAPPSIYPSGHEYAWIVSPFDLEPAPMPNWLVKYIKQRSSQSGDDEDQEGEEKAQVRTDEKLWRRAKKIIRQYPKITKWFKTPKPKDRSGHDWRLARLCLERGIDDDDLLYQIVLENKHGKARQHPNTDKYIRNCIRRATNLQECEEVLIPASELMKKDFDEDHELIGEGILNTSTSLIFGGESGTWKTTLALVTCPQLMYHL